MGAPRGGRTPIWAWLLVVIHVACVKASCSTDGVVVTSSTRVQFNLAQSEFQPNVTCIWAYSFPAGNVHKVNVTHRLGIGSDRLLFYNGLPDAVRDGGIEPFAMIYGTANSTQRTVVSSSANLTIVFLADALPKYGTGFSATSTPILPPNHCVNFSSISVSTAGNLSEPAGESFGVVPYASGTCGWLLVNPHEGGSLILILQRRGLNSGDIVQIFDGQNTSAPELATWNGQTAERSTIFSSQSSVFVLFTSLPNDKAPNELGFLLTYEPLTLPASVCASKSVVNASIAGVIGAPLPGSGARYAAGQACEWQLIAAAGSFITLRFGSRPELNNDSVLVVNNVSGALVMTIKSGSATMPRALVVNSSNVSVFFSSATDRLPASGFVLEYDVVDAVTQQVAVQTVPPNSEINISQTHYYGARANQTWIIPAATAIPYVYVSHYDLKPGDFIVIVDGFTGRLLKRLTGRSETVSPETPMEIISSGNPLNVTFVSASHYMYSDVEFVYGGFEAHTGEYEPAASCYPAAQVTGGRFGVPENFQPSGFGELGLAPYRVGLRCAFTAYSNETTSTMEPTDLQSIVRIPQYDIEDVHTLSFFDGADEYAPLLLTVSGQGGPLTILGTRGAITTIFDARNISLGNQTFRRGFNANVDFEPFPYRYETQFVQVPAYYPPQSWFCEDDGRVYVDSYRYSPQHKFDTTPVDSLIDYRAAVPRCYGWDGDLESYSSGVFYESWSYWVCVKEISARVALEIYIECGPVYYSKPFGVNYPAACFEAGNSNTLMIYYRTSGKGPTPKEGQGGLSITVSNFISQFPDRGIRRIASASCSTIGQSLQVASNVAQANMNCQWSYSTAIQLLYESSLTTVGRLTVRDSNRANATIVAQLDRYSVPPDVKGFAFWVPANCYITYSTNATEMIPFTVPNVLFRAVPALTCRNKDIEILVGYPRPRYAPFESLFATSNDLLDALVVAPANISCAMTFRSVHDLPLLLEFGYDNLDPRIRLTVYDGATSVSPVIDSHTHDARRFLSTGPVIHLVFATPNATRYIPGLMPQYRVQAINTTNAFCSTGVTTFYHATTIHSGDPSITISVPTYGYQLGVGAYPRNVNCTYIAEYGLGQYIEGQVTGLTEAADYVTVKENGAILARGSGQIAVNFTTRCGSLTIEFITNNSTTPFDRGFNVSLWVRSYQLAFPPSCRRNQTSGVCPSVSVSSTMNPAFRSCSTVIGRVSIASGMPQLSLPALVSVTGDIVSLETVFTSLFLPSLEYFRTWNMINVISISNMTTFGRLGRFVSLSWPSQTPSILPALVMPRLRSAMTISLTGFQSMNVIDLNALSYCGQLSIVFNGPTATSISLRTPSLRAVTRITLTNARLTEALTFTNFTPIVDVTVPLLCLILTNVNHERLLILSTTMSQLYLNNILYLERVELPYASQVDTLNILTCSSLGDVSFPLLTTSNNFLLSDGLMTEIRLPRLLFASLFYIRNTDFLDVLVVPGLQRCGSISLSGMALPSVNMDSLVSVSSMVTLRDMPLLTDIKACALTSVATSVLVEKVQLLSCDDTLALFQPLAPTVTVSGCSESSGVFTCNYNTTRDVNASACNYSLACVQAVIDSAYNTAGMSIHLAAGTYTGCSTQPLSFRGKTLTLFGDGPYDTVIDCEGNGRAFVFDANEPRGSQLLNIGLRNGSATTGGLLLITAGASPTVRNCSFETGSASTGGLLSARAGAHPLVVECSFSGGAASGNGGVISVLSASIELLDSTFVGNSAAGDGGAVALEAVTQQPTIVGCSFSGNRAGRAGGLFSSGPVTIIESSFSVNSATGFGGAVALIPSALLGVWANMSGVVAANNSASTGGGLYAYSTNLICTDCVVSGNVATSGDGGGLWAGCSDDYRFLNRIEGPCALNVVVKNATIIGNRALRGNGGGIVFSAVHAALNDSRVTEGQAAMGGGVYATASSVDITRSSIVSSSASTFGGGLYCEPLIGECDVVDSAISLNYATIAGGGVYLCVTGCQTSSNTSAHTLLENTLPSFSGSTVANNDVSSGGYGAEVASDPAILSWLASPLEQVVSGQSALGAAGATILLTDLYEAPVAQFSKLLGVSLYALHAEDRTDAAAQLVINGIRTAIVDRTGRASFAALSIASKTRLTGPRNLLLEARLAAPYADVSVRVPLQLLPCPPGSGAAAVLGDAGFVCATCPAGTMGSGAGDFVCAACPPGSYQSAAGSAACTLCPVDTSAAMAGATACVPCAAGFVASQPGSITCLDTSSGALAGDSGEATYIVIGAAVGAVLVLVVVVALFVSRLARKRTMKQYYLDNDSTIRTGAVESTLQRSVREMIVASSTTRIGGGVYADVYKARYEGSWIALKVLKGDMAGNELAAEEFRRETLSLTRIANARSHPGIVQLRFFLQIRPMCIGIEFCAGGTVKAALTRPLSITQKVTIIAEAASAFALLHELGIVHLDIKTDNLLLDEDEHVKVVDFGISRTFTDAFDDNNDASLASVQAMPFEYVVGAAAAEDSGTSSDLPSATATESMAATEMGSMVNPVFNSDVMTARTALTFQNAPLGDASRRPSSRPSTSVATQAASAFTPQYVDPERITADRNEFEFLQQADVFSFAIVMWAVMGQREPYAGEDPHDLIKQLTGDPSIRPLPPLESYCPPSYRQLMHRAWDVDRQGRPSMGELAQECRSILEAELGVAIKDGY